MAASAVLAGGDDLEVEVPDVEVEDEETLVVGVLGGVAGREQLEEAHLPVDLLVLQGELVAELDLLQVLPDRDVGHQGVDVVLGTLQLRGLLTQLGLDHRLALHQHVQHHRLTALHHLLPTLAPLHSLQ